MRIINQAILFYRLFQSILLKKQFMVLSQEVTTALAFIQSIPLHDNDGRKFYEGFIPMAGKPAPVHHIQDEIINDIPIRIYRPSAQDLLPAVVYIHGGWFNAGNLATHDTPLRTLSNLSGAIVIAIDYRLAPEHPFPAGLQDCTYILHWVLHHGATYGIDTNRVAIAGDSAGGALAAAIADRAICQALIYPVTSSLLNTPSWELFADGPNLTLAGAKIAWDQYTTDKTNPDASPLHAIDLTTKPPTLIITAEYDPLRDEAILYGEKLQAAGVALQLSQYPGMIHGFFQMGGMIPDGNKAIAEVATFLHQYLKP